MGPSKDPEFARQVRLDTHIAHPQLRSESVIGKCVEIVRLSSFWAFYRIFRGYAAWICGSFLG